MYGKSSISNNKSYFKNHYVSCMIDAHNESLIIYYANIIYMHALYKMMKAIKHRFHGFSI